MQPQTIAILGGTGAQGRGLATRLAAAGLRVIVGSRDREKAARVVSTIVADRGPLPLEPATNEKALESADLIIFAVSFLQVDAALASYRDRFRPGSLVIDISVPVTFERGQATFVDLKERSSAEHIRAALPPEVRLAAAFKTIPAKRLLGTASLECDEFVCGDSPAAREHAIDLVGRIPGLRPVDAGSLEACRAIERMTFLAVTLNRRYKSHEARFRVVGI